MIAALSTTSIRPVSRNFISLHELTLRIRDALRQPSLSRIWVVAEVSKRSDSKGHTYLELIQKEPGEEQPRAQIKACVWNESTAGIVKSFGEETGIDLGSGHKILFCASVQFHERHGLSLLVHEIDPVYTLGDLARQKGLNLERLRSEGLLDRQQSLSLPLVAQRLAVITSRQAFGGGDFFTTLKNPAHPYHFSGRLFPASVQGDPAPGEIIAQLERIQLQAENFDAVVIIRGGGQKSDFHCFENYALSRAIALCSLPVLTGIGHAWDEKTLSETVAHRNFITPTAAAEYLVGLSRHLDGRLDKARQVIARLAGDYLSVRQARLGQLRSLLTESAGGLLSDRKEKLSRLTETARTAPLLFLAGRRELFEKQSTHAAYLIRSSFGHQHQKLDRLGEALTRASLGGTGKQANYLTHLQMLLVQASQFGLRYDRDLLHRRQKELQLHSIEFTNTELLLLESMAGILKDHARSRIEGSSRQLGWLSDNLKALLPVILTGQRQGLGLLEARISQYDPVQMLRRGYSLTYANGQLLRSADQLRPGEEITTRIENTIIVSKVIALK